MNRKIIEWSSRRITTRLRAVRQVRRWYSALVPNRPRMVTLYTDAASAAPPPTSDAETAIIVAQAAIDPAKDQKCNQPRIRGLMCCGPGGGVPTVPVLTAPGYDKSAAGRCRADEWGIAGYRRAPG